MNLREKLQKIAKEKILKSQKITVTNKISKSRAGLEQKITKVAEQKTTYFPQVPIGYFGYTRPAEAKQQSKKIIKLATNFKGEFSHNINNAKTQAKKKQKNKVIEAQYQKSLQPSKR